MTLNLLAPEVARDPYPFYAELRQEGPVVPIEPGGMLAIGRYDDAAAVLRDVAHFSSAGLAKAYEPPWLGKNPVAHSMVGQDPPRHDGLRSLVNPAFSPPAMARIEGAVRALADELADAVVRRGDVDFIADFAAKLPVATLGRLIGLDIAALPRIGQWLAAMGQVTVARTPEQMDAVRQTLGEMAGHLGELIEASRRAPGDDFISDLQRAEIDGVALTHDEIVSFLFLLLGAGTSTTVNLLGNMMHVLATRPEEVERARADRAYIPRIVEEVIRYDAPVRALFRTAKGGAEVSGVPVPEGARVVVLLGSANRDERHFPNADQFIPDREKQAHLGFGHGIHFCLGPALARMEARFALEALLARISGYTLRPEGIVWEGGINTRGPKRLPMTFRVADDPPRAGAADG